MTTSYKMIKGLFRISKDRYLPCGLNMWQVLWWKFIPGVTVNVRWPSGEIVAGSGPEDPRWHDWGGAAYIRYESADPNDHYRPYLEKNVGKQGWDWNWGIADSISSDRLIIKIRRKHARHASIIGLMWS